MKKTGNRTAVTVISMLFIAIIIVSFYLYWSYRTTPISEISVEDMTEAQKLIQKDLDLNYPETPRETVKLFGNMIKALYDNIKDEDAEPLALKVRILYDEEFLEANPQDTYLKTLYSDLALWKKKDRRITSFMLVNDDQEQREEIDSIQYATEYISFTIQENRKFTEIWKVILRQDESSQWKILGWQTVPEDSE